jgi:PncC family amidohydrolase
MVDAAEETISVAVAESVTGGLVATRVVATPGSGTWFHGGIVAYAAETKHRLLEVDPGPVVSESAARQMAEGARRLFCSDVGVSTTGVAGPAPEDDCPVGTVYIGFADGGGSEARCHHLHGDPEQIRAAAATIAYSLILQSREGSSK